VQAHSSQHGDTAKLAELCRTNENFAQQHQQLCSGATHKHKR